MRLRNLIQRNRPTWVICYKGTKVAIGIRVIYLPIAIND
jgi:hypothetical protein